MFKVFCAPPGYRLPVWSRPGLGVGVGVGGVCDSTDVVAQLLFKGCQCPQQLSPFDLPARLLSHSPLSTPWAAESGPPKLRPTDL